MHLCVLCVFVCVANVTVYIECHLHVSNFKQIRHREWFYYAQLLGPQKEHYSYKPVHSYEKHSCLLFIGHFDGV